MPNSLSIIGTRNCTLSIPGTRSRSRTIPGTIPGTRILSGIRTHPNVILIDAVMVMSVGNMAWRRRRRKHDLHGLEGFDGFLREHAGAHEKEYGAEHGDGGEHDPEVAELGHEERREDERGAAAEPGEEELHPEVPGPRGSVEELPEEGTVDGLDAAHHDGPQHVGRDERYTDDDSDATPISAKVTQQRGARERTKRSFQPKMTESRENTGATPTCTMF